MSTTLTPTPATEAQRRSRLGWAIGLIIIAVAAAAAAGLWFLLSDEGEPTVAFDGQSASYSGPTTLTAGEITFTFDSTDYEPAVMFLVAQVTDDGITMEDVEALAASRPASGPVPPWIGTFHTEMVTSEVEEATFTLSEGRWLVNAHTSPNDTDRVHPAVILEVEAE